MKKCIFIIIITIIIIIIITIINTFLVFKFLQDIYNNIPETNRVYRA